MSRSFKIILQAVLGTTVVTLWFAVATCLCLLFPPMGLLEIFLVMLGSMILVNGRVILAREVSKLVDLRY